MCGIAALSIGMGILSSVAQFAAQSSAADAQTQMAENNKTNALAADRENQKQLTQRTIQEQDAKTEQDRIGEIQSAQASSQVEVGANESGLSGISVDNLVADVHRREAENQSIRGINYNNTLLQLNTQKQASAVQTQGRIDSVQPGQQPSPLNLVAGIGNAFLGGYRIQQQNTAQIYTGTGAS